MRLTKEQIEHRIENIKNITVLLNLELWAVISDGENLVAAFGSDAADDYQSALNDLTETINKANKEMDRSISDLKADIFYMR